jgi:serine/threonine protein kinase
VTTPSGSDSVRAHRVVAGRYALVAPLGSGGMGTVWRGEDRVLGRQVAVKEVVFPHGLSDHDREVLRERTRREARAAARLDHPSAVTVYDVVEDEGHPFLVMELVEARTLADVVRTDGPLAPAAAAEVGLAVLGALEAAHARGIVHRDVKPGNVLLRHDRPDDETAPGRVVLTDFGIATSPGDASITSTGLILGSPAYIAPERARGHAPEPASDLWSLGATLFTAVEGRPPYDGGDPLATVTAVVTGEHEPFRAAGPLEHVIDGLLERDPARRLDAPTARRMLEDVARSAAGAAAAPRPVPPVVRDDRSDGTAVLPVGPRPPVEPRPPVAPRPPMRPPRPAAPVRSPRRRTALLLAVAAALVVASFAGGLSLLAGGSDDPSPQAGSGRGATSPTPAESDEPQTDEPQADEPQADAFGRPEGVPADWVRYTHPSEGWALYHPPGYTVSDWSPELKQFRDEETRYTLRVDYTDDPRPSALQAWQEASPGFAQRLTNYEQLRLEKVDYRGYDAADLEFTYFDSGADLRVLDRTFIVEDGSGDREAFALYWQVPASRFDESLPQFRRLAAGFVPNAPGGAGSASS